MSDDRARDRDEGPRLSSSAPQAGQPALLTDVRKIAVLRANAVGDFIFALPALEALRRTYPAAEIVLLARAWHQAFLLDRPGPVDRVVVVPPSSGVSEANDYPEDTAELDRFFAAMAEEEFDLAIQLHGGGRYSNPFVRRLGARLTVGLQSGDAVPLDCNVPYIYFQSEILRYLEVVAQVGAVPLGLEPCVTVTTADLAESLTVVPEGGRLVALHPGVGHPGRRWPAERFAAVGDAMTAEGARVVVTGTDGERELAEQVVQQMRGEARSLAGRLSLGGLAGLLTRCAVVVSNDSGPLHLARAVGASTVGIYWCFNLITAGPLSRTRHRPLSAWRIHCPVCGRDQTRDPCDHPASYVAEIPAEDAIEAALDLWRQPEGVAYRRMVKRAHW